MGALGSLGGMLGGAGGLSGLMGGLGGMLGGSSSSKDLKKAMQAMERAVAQGTKFTQDQLDVIQPTTTEFGNIGLGAAQDWQSLLANPQDQVMNSGIYDAMQNVTQDQLARQQSLVGANNQRAFSDAGQLGSQNFLGALGALQQGYQGLAGTGLSGLGQFTNLAGQGIQGVSNMTGGLVRGIGALAPAQAQATNQMYQSLGNIPGQIHEGNILDQALPGILSQFGVGGGGSSPYGISADNWQQVGAANAGAYNRFDGRR
jgi:hypothetical protein